MQEEIMSPLVTACRGGMQHKVVNVSQIYLVVYVAALLLLVKCYDIKKAKSLADLTILPLVRSRGGKKNIILRHAFLP